MDTIRYRGKKYTLFDIELKEFGKQIAAHERLEEALMMDDESRTKRRNELTA